MLCFFRTLPILSEMPLTYGISVKPWVFCFHLVLSHPILFHSCCFFYLFTRKTIKQECLFQDFFFFLMDSLSHNLFILWNKVFIMPVSWAGWWCEEASVDLLVCGFPVYFKTCLSVKDCSGLKIYLNNYSYKIIKLVEFILNFWENLC